MTSMILAFVFDLDGTLVETEELKALSYARAAIELRPDLVEADVVEAFKDFVGRSRQEVATGLVRRFGLEEAARSRMSKFGVMMPRSERKTVMSQVRLVVSIMTKQPRGGGRPTGAARRRNSTVLNRYPASRSWPE
jgi:phosphoglycolate phosphatase-like HAD superfamily hydrolase